MKLRSKLTLLLTLIASSAVLGATYVGTRSFVGEQKVYLNELNTLVAPNLASALSAEFRYLRQRLPLIDQVTGSEKTVGMVESAFEGMRGAIQVDIYDHGKLNRSVLLAGKTSRVPEPALLARLGEGARPSELLSDGKGYLIFWSVEGDRTYLVWIKEEALREVLDRSLTLSVFLVNEAGVVLARNEKASQESQWLAEVAQVARSSAKEAFQTVIAREIRDQSGRDVLLARAPVAGLSGASVIVLAPASELSVMLKQALRSSAPLIALVLLIALICGVFFSGQMVAPIEALIEATGKVASGSWKVPVSPGGRVSRDEIGKLSLAFARMVQDLEARDRALKKANEELLRSERLAALGRFSAGIAHEVKNPLSSILGYGQLIQRKPDSAVVNEYVAYILEETRRASKIITELLTFARQKPPTRVRASLNEILSHAHAKLMSQGEASGVQTILDLPPQGVFASVDPEQIYQVLSNLVTNAYHALETSSAASRRVELVLKQEDSRAFILIRDNGCGISEENLAKVFEPFFSTKEVGKGTGLGLSICHGIVSQHGGQIEVESRVGEGTTFRIVLPVDGDGA